jgi:hypothetical protein
MQELEGVTQGKMWELEFKLPMFIFKKMLFCYEEGQDNNVIVVAFFFIFEKKKSNNNNVIAFFSMFEKKKMMTMCHRLFLWWCCYEEGAEFFVFFFLLEKKAMTHCSRHPLLWVFLYFRRSRRWPLPSSVSFMLLLQRR